MKKDNRSPATESNPFTQPTRRFRCASRRWPARIREKFHGIRIASNSYVARKFHASGISTRSIAENAVTNLRMATMQLVGLRMASRVRTIPNVRRRIPVTIVNEPAEAVTLRHAVHNVDTPLEKPRTVQAQRPPGVTS